MGILSMSRDKYVCCDFYHLRLALLACQLYNCIFVITGAPPLKMTPVNSINREHLESGVASNTTHTHSTPSI